MSTKIEINKCFDMSLLLKNRPIQAQKFFDWDFSTATKQLNA